MGSKTGSGGRPWVVLEAPRPPKVSDHYEYWGDPPPELSLRCWWWLRQIQRGWRPNRRLASECYDCSAEWYGIYIWEWLNIICPALSNGRFADSSTPPGGPPKAIEMPEKDMTVEQLLKSQMLKKLNEEFLNQIFYGDGGHGPTGIRGS